MHQNRLNRLLTLLSLFLIRACFATQALDFNDHILPILSEHCYDCHGPDAGQREADLRLDTFQGATRSDPQNHPAIMPGSPESSLLIKRIESNEPDSIMPPPRTGRRLTNHQKAQLRLWIEQGAEYNRHWAYQTIRSPEPPSIKNQDWPSNSIDHFVLRKLENQDIEPSPQADRSTLIRRLYLDLIGLLPSAEEAQSFLQDRSSNAYESLVDNLLASPHFGERWARHWLDYARYADSDGYEKDNPRPNAWRYRDWVIQAINEDLPFDQFTLHQLAGDLIANPTPATKLATAFHRQTLTNTEGGTNPEQWRVAAVMDRTETTGSLWLGLTIGCARCHDHKYDVVSQQEYYQLYAFFNNADENTLTIDKSAIAVDEFDENLTIWRQERRALEDQLFFAAKNDLAGRQRWIDQNRDRLAAYKKRPLQYVNLQDQTIVSQNGSQYSVLEDHSILAVGANPDQEETTLIGYAAEQPIQGIRLSLLPDSSLPRNGPGRAENGNLVLSEVTLTVGKSFENKLNFARATSDFSQKGWEVAKALDGRNDTGWGISPQVGKPHQAEFFLSKAYASSVDTKIRIHLSQNYQGGKHNLGRFRVELIIGTPPPSIDPSTWDLLADSKNNHSLLANERLIRLYSEEAEVCQPIRAELETHLKRKPVPPQLTVRTLTERTVNSRQTHVLNRGEFTRPEEQVKAGGMAALPSILVSDQSQPPTRLDLARWFFHPEQPLTPRVTANHIWSKFFGEGLVRTLNDFGVRGDRPTHPHLLDYLASYFRDHSWSRKKLVKHIVMSSTYRQSSRHRADMIERDPRNQLLARQNRFRVEAETIRDIFLHASGLLSQEIGGPSVFPPTSPDVVALTYNSNVRWQTSEGGNRYRRGLYTFFKRTAPHPNLTTFDCPDSNVSCLRRDRSNTPLGALTTMNNEVFVEAAKALATLSFAISPKPDHKSLETTFKRVLSRAPSEEEIGILSQLASEARLFYQNHPSESETLFPNDLASERQSLATWFSITRAIMNLDESITRP